MTKRKRTKAGSGRIFHYYARYLVHPSGVTDAADHWLEASQVVDSDSRILAANVGGRVADPARVRTVRHLGRGRRSWVPIGLLSLLREGDLVVLHEGWVLSNVVAALFTMIRRARYVVMPHGVYEDGIVSNQKDRLGLRRRAEAWYLRHAIAVHVFYPGEQAVVRRVEPSVSRFITLPNGAPPANASWDGSGEYFLYLGRIDPYHKGLDNLLHFWSRLEAPRPPLKLVGPDFRGGKQVVDELRRRLGLEDIVSIEQHASGERKDQLIRAARAYVHPARWESCSIALLEMLSAGVPCLVSTTIHAAQELAPDGVFEIANFEDPGFDGASVLERVDGNVELGQRASRWVSERGDWRSVMLQFVPEYMQLIELETRTRP